MPTTPSPFVANVLAPIRAFRESAPFKRLPAAARSEWVHSVAAAVTRRYHEEVAGSLDTVRKDEEARRRLSIKPAPTSAAAGTEGATGDGSPDAEASDSDKICAQLRLDARAFSLELMTVDVAPAILPEYAELMAVV